MPPKRKGRKSVSTKAAETNKSDEAGPSLPNETIVQGESVPKDKASPSSDHADAAEKSNESIIIPLHSNEGRSISAHEKASERMEKLKQLRSRMIQSAKDNRQAVYSEHQRLKVDPRLESRLERKKGEAELKLAKQDALEAGEDFERKRAWDWSIEESQAWDKKVEKKKRMVERALFSDYTQESNKAYKREMKRFKPDIEGYERERVEALSRGQVVTNDNGKLTAIDADRNFYRDADSLGFFENKPSKAAIDRLVEDIEKAEQQREKNRRKRHEDGDITYINDRNKKFNERVARHYDKYTKEIRDSFERGTAL